MTRPQRHGSDGETAAARDRVEDNLNPVGRAYYGFSMLLYTRASLSETPFNLVFEARP